MKYFNTKRMMPPALKAVLKRGYMRLFKRHMYQAYKDYKYTDEHMKFVHILEAINYARVAGLPPVYFEFGCHSGRTFSAAVRATRYLKMKNAQFFAFDSFQGLPAVNLEEDGIFQEGLYATPIEEFIHLVKKMTGVQVPRENIVEGFYSQSLTPELQARMPKAGVVHIDVDLYSSTIEILQFIKPLILIGTVLIFDDWYAFPPGTKKGEARALKEFCSANPTFAIEKWKAYSTFGRSFFVTSL